MTESAWLIAALVLALLLVGGVIAFLILRRSRNRKDVAIAIILPSPVGLQTNSHCPATIERRCPICSNALDPKWSKCPYCEAAAAKHSGSKSSREGCMKQVQSARLPPRRATQVDSEPPSLAATATGPLQKDRVEFNVFAPHQIQPGSRNRLDPDSYHAPTTSRFGFANSAGIGGSAGAGRPIRAA